MYLELLDKFTVALASAMSGSQPQQWRAATSPSNRRN
jgi:hypothetical protein